MPVPSVIASTKAAAKAYRPRVSIESIKQGIEASRRRPGVIRGDSASSEGSTIAERVFRNVSFVTDLDRRYDTASRCERIVPGDEGTARASAFIGKRHVAEAGEIGNRWMSGPAAVNR